MFSLGGAITGGLMAGPLGALGGFILGDAVDDNLSTQNYIEKKTLMDKYIYKCDCCGKPAKNKVKLQGYEYSKDLCPDCMIIWRDKIIL